MPILFMLRENQPFYGDFYDLFHLPITNNFVKTHKDLLFYQSVSIQQGQNSLQKIIIDDFMNRKDQISKEIIKTKSIFIDYLKSINYHANSIALDSTDRIIYPFCLLMILIQKKSNSYVEATRL